MRARWRGHRRGTECGWRKAESRGANLKMARWEAFKQELNALASENKCVREVGTVWDQNNRTSLLWHSALMITDSAKRPRVTST